MTVVLRESVYADLTASVLEVEDSRMEVSLNILMRFYRARCIVEAGETGGLGLKDASVGLLDNTRYRTV